jgi:hypothetical protein
MTYQTKRARITNYLKKAIASIQVSGKDGSLRLLVSATSLELGVAEKDILEVLETFQNAGVLKINQDIVVVF